MPETSADPLAQATTTFAMRLKEEIEHCRRYKHDTSVAVIYIDALSQLREQLGALACDASVNAIGGVLKTSLRQEDIYAHTDEQSFIIILSGLSAASAACSAQSIKDKIDAHTITYNWRNIKVTVSIGLASYPVHGNEAEKLIAGATAAAQFALNAGGDRIVIA